MFLLCILNLPYRRIVSEPAKEVLRGLLERNIFHRLGSSSDSQEIKATTFFNVYDYNKLLKKEYEAEFKPPVATSDTDVRNFDKEFTSERAADSMVTSHMSETMQEKSNFVGFTYKGDANMN